MTLKDVALMANCSVATVSKALKNSSEISEGAKQRILAVAKDCGYFKKATTRCAVLGGVKLVIFNDIKGDSADVYFELQQLAKKCGLTVIYISVSERESVELLNQLGAFGLILKGEKLKSIDEKILILQNNVQETKNFLNKISSFMPQRPSRAASQKPVEKMAAKTKIKENIKKEKYEQPVQKKEEIWLL